MKLIKITIKSITKFQLKKIYYWFNDKEMSKYLRTRHRTMKKIIEILSRRKTHNFMINEKVKQKSDFVNKIGFLFNIK